MNSKILKHSNYWIQNYIKINHGTHRVSQSAVLFLFTWDLFLSDTEHLLFLLKRLLSSSLELHINIITCTHLCNISKVKEIHLNMKMGTLFNRNRQHSVSLNEM